MTVQHIDSMQGFGDNIYQRPFVKRLAAQHERVSINSPWPELYIDIPNLHFVRSDTQLRTQAKNVRRSSVRYEAPCPGRAVEMHYDGDTLPTIGIVRAMAKKLHQAADVVMDLPATHGVPAIADHPRLAIVRPVTTRREWNSANRNPNPQYVNAIASYLVDAGYYVLLVADIDGRDERLVGDEFPRHNAICLNGELTPMELIAAFRAATVVVGGVGWAVPMAIATGARMLCVLGGRGGHNNPYLLRNWNQHDNIRWMTPDNFCMCQDSQHACDKHISHFNDKLQYWANTLEGKNVALG